MGTSHQRPKWSGIVGQAFIFSPWNAANVTAAEFLKCFQTFYNCRNTFFLSQAKCLQFTLKWDLKYPGGKSAQAFPVPVKTMTIEHKTRETKSRLWSFGIETSFCWIHLDGPGVSGVSQTLFKGQINNPALHVLIFSLAYSVTFLWVETSAVILDTDWEDEPEQNEFNTFSHYPWSLIGGPGAQN